MEDSQFVTLIFPNYSSKPIVQKWRVSTLKKIPYFATLFDGPWKDSSSDEVTLEFDPALFTKMIKEITAKDTEEEYALMKDFFGITSTRPKKKPRAGLFHNKEVYKTLTFTKESRRQVVDLGEANTASKICGISLTSPGFSRKDYVEFSYFLGETSLGNGSSYRGVPDKLETILNAKLAEGQPIENFEISYCLAGLWPPVNPAVQAFIKIGYN